MLQLLGQNKTLREESHYALMISEIDRANAIITKFLSLAKNTRVNLQQNDITKIVEYLFPLMQADAMVSGKRIVADIRPVPLLWLDQGQVRQLILNLVRNALEAMDEGGRVIIRTYTHAGYVVLAVQDEGPGIDKGVLAKLGTPFVTTKESGTGLGLAVCYSIAQRHKATIKVETGPRGTTFYVRFRPGERDPEE
jgi:two-component system, sporulation sensor kinase E